MILTHYIEGVEDELYTIHDASFPFPDFDDPTFIEKKIVIDKGKVIGCGLAKITTEFILILDRSKSLKSRVQATKVLKSDIVKSLSRRGIRDTHIFVNDDQVERFATHMGFRKCPEKSSMSLMF
jgi:hypothetical protein